MLRMVPLPRFAGEEPAVPIGAPYAAYRLRDRPCRPSCQTSPECTREAYGKVARGNVMKKTWTRPVIAERPAGMEVTAYLPAEL
ncbi:MAG: pyrroloquinoline quinone precursor peptide PqqA [Propylenella sp.]